MSAQDADFYAATDTGFISQNVYLYCASAGLATVVRSMMDKAALAKAMKLRPDQKIILAQTGSCTAMPYTVLPIQIPETIPQKVPDKNGKDSVLR